MTFFLFIRYPIDILDSIGMTFWHADFYYVFGILTGPGADWSSVVHVDLSTPSRTLSAMVYRT